MSILLMLQFFEGDTFDLCMLDDDNVVDWTDHKVY